MMHLPEAIQQRIDWPSLTLCNESFIGVGLKQLQTDVLYSAKLLNSSRWLYFLIEHQSTVDPLMPIRLRRYSYDIMLRHMETTQDKIPPLVIPMVLYHGKQQYSSGADILDMFAPEDRKIAEQFLSGPFQLIDLKNISDASLCSRTWSGVMQLTQKHAYATEHKATFEQLLELFRYFVHEGGNSIIMTTMEYLLQVAEDLDVAAVVKALEQSVSQSIGDQVMTVAQRLHDEGFSLGVIKGQKKGRIEGKLEGKLEGKFEGKLEGELQGQLIAKRKIAKNLLAQGLDPELVRKATEIPQRELHKLLLSMLTA